MKRIFFLFALLLASAGALAQINNGGGGSSTPTTSTTSPTQPAFLVTAAPYNAKCDGSTDDTTAIQAAINAAAATGNGGTVVFPVGQCNTSSVLTITTNNIVLTGQGGRQSGSGANGTVVMSTSASADILDITGSNSSFPSSYIQTVIVKNMGFRRSVSPTGTSNGIRVQYCLNCKLQEVESWDSVNNFFQINVNDLWYEKTWAVAGPISGASADLVGYNVSGVANSTNMLDAVAGGTGTGFIGKGLLFASSGSTGTDINVIRFATNSQTNIGVSIEGPVEDVYFMNAILDACPTTCFRAINSTAGALSVPNQITFSECHCLAGTASTSANIIQNSSGVSLIGGYYTCQAASCNSIIITGASATGNLITGIIATSTGGTNTSAPIAISTNATNNVISGNTVFAPSGNGFAAGIGLVATATGNTITGNVVRGFGTEGILLDGTSTGNLLSGNRVDTTNITTAVLDQSGGNTYTSSTLAPGVIGDAFSYKATATITGPIPVKFDTSNANQVVTTVTTDTGAGIVIGICPNSPTAGNACLVMNHGTVPLTLGTGTCAIGNWAIVDTTTNGRIKCQTTFATSSGAIMGTAQAANSTVGTTSNFAIGLR